MSKSLYNEQDGCAVQKIKNLGKLLDSLLYEFCTYCDLWKGTMLSGLKFIPRDQIDKKEKKWYDSEEDLSSSSEKSGSQSEQEHDRKKHRRRKGKKKRHDDSSDNERKSRSKKTASSRRKNYSSEDESLSCSEREDTCEEGSHDKGGMNRWKDDEKRGTKGDHMGNDLIDDSKGSQSQNSSSIVRKEMGLEWMLRPKDNTEKASNKAFHIEPEEAPAEEIKKDNPRELNPYLKNNGSGYPEDSDGVKTGDKRMLSTAVIGDGGASWRLKALKRAQEQAARDGRKLQEVVEERWGSMGHFAASVASHSVAPTHAHLQAIKHRRKGLMNEEKANVDEENDQTKKDFDQKSMKDFHPRHPKMRVPKVDDSLSWGKRGSKKLSTEDTALVSTALSSLNKFSNDGRFMDAFMHQKEDNSGGSSNSLKSEGRAGPKSSGIVHGETKDDAGTVKPDMSANQLAAKALQLRMKGKPRKHRKLLKEVENTKRSRILAMNQVDRELMGLQADVSARQKKKEDDADLHLAQKIMHNHRYSVSNQADEEYDYDDGPRRKTRKKGGAGNHKASEITNSANRFLTQQDRCQFCFENPNRPKHLIVAIANFTYLSLPQQQPVVPGHCAILTLQHESSTRTVDDDVWNEIRNFKKCLIMMFAKQEKDVLFLETVMGLAQQRRHCLVECIPLPQDVAKQAPVYFKKAIDEAEDEWSQHNAKKLIDTSEKGLRSSIPKNFPYFHVEFGLDKGFVHVIDDEKEFKSSFGLNVVRGMLRLPAEDMHRRRRNEPVDIQKQAVASFARDWEPFDWTKQLD
ncbi:UNVERIFIED_CONTAM: CWF19-like protein 2 [Sesamum angustifolium]|uniref:CWF19-like protein 2 n=1 Tax=Sesamum angustifolium TaxID=2727405 RepID=A0AAW2NZE6_9LAMI